MGNCFWKYWPFWARRANVLKAGERLHILPSLLGAALMTPSLSIKLEQQLRMQ
jgi:hypothetical protein